MASTASTLTTDGSPAWKRASRASASACSITAPVSAPTFTPHRKRPWSSHPDHASSSRRTSAPGTVTSDPAERSVVGESSMSSSHGYSRAIFEIWATVQRGARPAICASHHAGAWRVIGASWSSDSSPRWSASTHAGNAAAQRATSRSFDAVAGATPVRQRRYASGVQSPSPCHSSTWSSIQTAADTSRACRAFRCPPPNRGRRRPVRSRRMDPPASPPTPRPSQKCDRAAKEYNQMFVEIRLQCRAPASRCPAGFARDR